MSEPTAKYILIISILIITSFIGYFQYLGRQEFRFTIATATRKLPSTNGGQMIDFSYSVRNENFTNSNRIRRDDEKKYRRGRKYIVKFSTIKPDYAEILLDFPIPNNKYNNPPEEGWEQNPLE